MEKRIRRLNDRWLPVYAGILAVFTLTELRRVVLDHERDALVDLLVCAIAWIVFALLWRIRRL